MAGKIQRERRDSSRARVPSVPPGKAIVFTRYEQEKSVVMNPEDFNRLAGLDDALAEIAFEPVELSDLALAAHRLEDTPAGSLEDPDAIRALLGL